MSWLKSLRCCEACDTKMCAIHWSGILGPSAQIGLFSVRVHDSTILISFSMPTFSFSFYLIGSRDFFVTRHHMTWSHDWSHDGHMISSHDDHMTIPPFVHYDSSWLLLSLTHLCIFSRLWWLYVSPLLSLTHSDSLRVTFSLSLIHMGIPVTMTRYYYTADLLLDLA